MASCAIDFGDYPAARRLFTEALEYDPTNIDVRAGLMLCELENASAPEMRAIYLKVLFLVRDRPSCMAYFNRILFLNLSLGELTPEERLEDHLRFAQWFERPHMPWPLHNNEKDPDRKLKVGYVSGDFFEHSVTKFFLPVLAAHDRTQIEVYLYSNREYQDKTTLAIRQHADHWVECYELSDTELDQAIRGAEIDILIDLSGHTLLNRLGVFARKPAPIQATWIGMAGTTGLSAMDYRITEADSDSPGLTDKWHSEKLVRLEPSLSVMAKPENLPSIPTRGAGVDDNSFLFASLNQLYKVNAEVIRVWCSILSQSPHSRIVFCNVSTSAAEGYILELLAPYAVDPQRLIFKATVPEKEFLDFLLEVDMALDTFPYNGGATTSAALWMGVPTVTLAGTTSVSRIGVAALSAVGLRRFVARNETEYVSLAVKASLDPSAVRAGRQPLRERLENAHGTLAVDFAKSLSRFYRAAWKAWCDSTVLDTDKCFDTSND